MPPRCLRAASLRLLAPLALAIAAACGPEDGHTILPTPTYSVAPAALSLVTGDSGTFVVSSPGVRGSARVRVVSSAPSVTTVDSVTSLGAPVRVRGLAYGTAILTITSTVDGSTVSISLPVAVAPRPTVPVGILLAPSAATIRAGDTVRFTAAIIASAAGAVAVITVRPAGDVR